MLSMLRKVARRAAAGWLRELAAELEQQAPITAAAIRTQADTLDPPRATVVVVGDAFAFESSREQAARFRRKEPS